MPAYRCRERVVFLKDFNKDAFGRTQGAFPVGPNSEQKWVKKGDTGVVSSWSKGGWLKVRLDRHGAIVTVRAGPYTGRPTPPVTKKTVWSQEAHDAVHTELRKRGDRVRSLVGDLYLHLEEAAAKGKPADVEIIESARLELETAARLLQKLSFSLPTQISPFPKSFGALQSRANTPSPVEVPKEANHVLVEAVEVHKAASSRRRRQWGEFVAGWD